MLLQRPLHVDASDTIKFNVRLTKSDMEMMQELAAKHIDVILGVLKALPTPLMLVMRWECTCAYCVTVYFLPLCRRFRLAPLRGLILISCNVLLNKRT